MNPYLSLVMGIGGIVSNDLLARLHDSTNNTIALAERCNVNMELIIVEWNMPHPIHYETFLPKTNIPIRVIHTGDAHSRVPNPYGFRYFEWYPKNIGIRRAKGDYVLSTNPDDIFSPALFEYFSRYPLCDRYVYRVNRFDYRDNEVYAICRNDGVFWPGDPLPVKDNRSIHYCASGDFTLMSKQDWFKIHGNPETGYNHTVDGQTLYLADQAGMYQEILPHPIFHPDHVRTLNHAFMPDWDDSKPHGVANTEWGLSDEVFEETKIIGRGTAKLAVLPSIPKPGTPKWRTWPDPKPGNVVLIKVLDDRLRRKNGQFVYLDKAFADRWIKSGQAKLYLTTSQFSGILVK